MQKDTCSTITQENMAKAAAFIIEHIKINQYPPSVREIGAHVGFSSSATAQKLITNMLKNGYIEVAPGKARTIRVSNTGKKLAQFTTN